MTQRDPSLPASGGVPIDDEQIDQLAAEAETGYDVETLRRRGGRRPIGSADDVPACGRPTAYRSE